MMPIIVKEPTEVEKLEKQIIALEADIQKKRVELKKAKDKSTKHPSVGYFRARFKGG